MDEARRGKEEGYPKVDAKYTKVIFAPLFMGTTKGFRVDEASPEQLMNTTLFWFPEMKVKFILIYDAAEWTELYVESKDQLEQQKKG